MATATQIKKLRDKLISVAKKPDPRIAYSSVDHIVGLNVSGVPTDRGKLGAMGEQEVTANRPFLPVVVVRKWSRRPGRGFYPMVRKMSTRYHGILKNSKLHDAVLVDIQTYWRAAE